MARPGIAHVWLAVSSLIVLSGAAGAAAHTGSPQLAAASLGQDQSQDLQEMGLALKHLRRKSLDLIGEVERRKMEKSGLSDIVDPIPEPQIPNDETLTDLGTAEPPRQHYVEMYMFDIDHLFSLIHDITSKFSDSASAVDATNWHQVRHIVDDIQGHITTLHNLTIHPPYQNLPIGKEALAIYNDTTEIQKPWRRTVEGFDSK